MKIHSNTLTSSDVYKATKAHGMRGVDAEVTTSGSRSRARRLDVKLTGTSNRNQNPGTGPRYNVEKAATWDEWGMVIDFLFLLDEDAVIGQYKGYEHFKACTFGRYESLTQPYAHGNHKWERNMTTGASECTGCDAKFDFNEFWRK